jgi:DNA-binding NarL/FixJ family response regulator
MRVVLIGAPAARERLRRGLGAPVEVAGECASLTEALSSSIKADAFVVARASLPAADDDAVTTEVIAAEALTARERQVLQLLAEGLSNKGIAARLAISDQTVKFHVAAIAAKLGAANRTDAVRLAVRRGLISL